MQVLKTLRLMVMVMMGWSHCRTHTMVAVLMMRRTPSMWMILGGMMLMRMIGWRQEVRSRRIHTRTVAG